jgi:hypothetical protein
VADIAAVAQVDVTEVAEVAVVPRLLRRRRVRACEETPTERLSATRNDRFSWMTR